MCALISEAPLLKTHAKVKHEERVHGHGGWSGAGHVVCSLRQRAWPAHPTIVTRCVLCRHGGAQLRPGPTPGLQVSVAGESLDTDLASLAETRVYSPRWWASRGSAPDNCGPSLSLSQAMGGAATGGVEALLSPVTMEDVGSSSSGRQQFEARLAYGLPVYNNRLTLRRLEPLTGRGGRPGASPWRRSGRRAAPRRPQRITNWKSTSLSPSDGGGTPGNLRTTPKAGGFTIPDAARFDPGLSGAVGEKNRPPAPPRSDGSSPVDQRPG